MKDKFALLYLENQLCFPLYAASRLTTKIYTPYLDKMGITYPQYLVLMVLWQYDEQSVNTIGKRLYLESNTLTPLLKRLEQKELIQRNRSKKDERTVLISLTKKGKNLKEEALSIPESIIESFQGETVTQEEIETFQNTLSKLVDLLNKKTGGKIE
ncbi:MarR family transcriptional regulator [Marivirga lumbricoides]|uniref:HTH-type transcriptional regulator SarZ n=1 Tax=Marivirga lumbricoides TaxID=1046115 RepID=A0ABQ1LTF8_9BACT|nr:MarR family transcriptional regulator [Marivirga lumbricoides]